jgi:D-glycero-D-manno-heptose 1,7-bisphosphate phosphatase
VGKHGKNIPVRRHGCGFNGKTCPSNELTTSVELVNAIKVTQSGEQAILRRCVFFDRDGVVNLSPGSGYVIEAAEFSLHDGVGEVLQTVHDRGWLAIIVSSQRCVAKGLIDLEGLELIHRSMQTELMDRYGSKFDAIYAYTGQTGTEDWEKPNPGMIDQACKDYAIDPGKSILIGDQDRDIEMAIRAGIGQTIRVLTGPGNQENKVGANQTVKSIEEMVVAVRELL